jgi:hypothetical protein
MVAPWIRDWNLFEEGEDGKPERIPPPIDAADESLRSFMRLDPVLTSWILDTLENAYKGGKGSSNVSGTSETLPEPTSEPMSDAPEERKPSTRPSRAKSSGR